MSQFSLFSACPAHFFYPRRILVKQNAWTQSDFTERDPAQQTHIHISVHPAWYQLLQTPWWSQTQLSNCVASIQAKTIARSYSLLWSPYGFKSLHRENSHVTQTTPESQSLGTEVWCACLTFCPTSHSYTCIEDKLPNSATCLWWPRGATADKTKIPWARIVENVNDSRLGNLAIKSNSVSSVGKHPGRRCQTLGPCRAAGSHSHVFSKYIISRLSFGSVYNCRKSSHVEWAVEIAACMRYRYLWLWLHMFEPVRPHSSAASIDL